MARNLEDEDEDEKRAEKFPKQDLNRYSTAFPLPTTSPQPEFAMSNILGLTSQLVCQINQCFIPANPLNSFRMRFWPQASGQRRQNDFVHRKQGIPSKFVTKYCFKELRKVSSLT